MQEIKSILEKIAPYTQADTVSAIEKDILLAHVRSLYEHILELIPEKAPASPVSEEEESLAPEENEEQHTHEEDTDVMEIATAASSAPEDTVGQEKEKEKEKEKEEEEGEEAEMREETTGAETILFPETVVPESESEWAEPQTFELEPELKKENREGQAFEVLSGFRVWNKDIRTYIGINDKYNFISELFGNNAEAYEEILNELNMCENKDEAFRFLENSGITTLYKWEEDGLSKQIFYNILSQFFSSR